MPSHHCSWLWPSWRLGTLNLPCSTAERPSRHQREHSLTPRYSTSSTFRMIRSLLSTYPFSFPCACLFCCHCSKSCPSSDSNAERSMPRRTEHEKTLWTKQLLYLGSNPGMKEKTLPIWCLLFHVNFMIVMNACCLHLTLGLLGSLNCCKFPLDFSPSL